MSNEVESLKSQIEALFRLIEQMRKNLNQQEIELKSHLEKAKTVEEYESKRIEEMKRDLEKLQDKLADIPTNKEIEVLQKKVDGSVSLKGVTVLLSILGLGLTGVAFVFNYIMNLLDKLGSLK